MVKKFARFIPNHPPSRAVRIVNKDGKVRDALLCDFAPNRFIRVNWAIVANAIISSPGSFCIYKINKARYRATGVFVDEGGAQQLPRTMFRTAISIRTNGPFVFDSIFQQKNILVREYFYAVSREFRHCGLFAFYDGVFLSFLRFFIQKLIGLQVSTMRGTVVMFWNVIVALAKGKGRQRTAYWYLSALINVSSH